MNPGFNRNFKSLKIKETLQTKSYCSSPQQTTKQLRSFTPLSKHKCHLKDTKLQIQVKGPSFEFGLTPRFEKFFIPVTNHKPSDLQIHEINKRIKQNKISSRLSPTERSLLSRQKAQKHKIRSEVTKLAKECLMTLKKEKFQGIIQLKTHKYSLRLKQGEFKRLAKVWSQFLSLCGFCFCITKVIENRKRLKNRNRQRLKWIRSICRAIGKFRIVLRKVRARKSLKKLKVTFLPVIKLWVRAKHTKYRNELANYLESAVSEAGLYRLIVKMNDNCKFIQKSLRSCLAYKRIVYKKLIQGWETVEAELSSKTRKTLKFSITPEQSPDKKTRFSVPLEVRLVFIRKFLKEKFKNFLKVLNVHLSECREIDKTNEENKWDILNHDIVLPYPTRPVFPLFINIFPSRIFQELRKSALKNRTSWEFLLDQDRLKLEKSY